MSRRVTRLLVGAFWIGGLSPACQAEDIDLLVRYPAESAFVRGEYAWVAVFEEGVSCSEALDSGQNRETPVHQTDWVPHCDLREDPSMASIGPIAGDGAPVVVLVKADPDGAVLLQGCSYFRGESTVELFLSTTAAFFETPEPPCTDADEWCANGCSE